MQKALFPGYTVGPDAYEDIVNICSAYGKKAAIIGGRKALAAAEPKIRKAVEGSGIGDHRHLLVRRRGLPRRTSPCSSPRWRTPT